MSDTQLKPAAYDSGRIGHRHGLMVLSFLGALFKQSSRVALSVSMVAMTAHHSNGTQSHNLNVTTTSVACPMDMPRTSPSDARNHSVVPVSVTFDWDSQTQGMLHGAFFYGYLLSQIPGGWIAHRIGTTRPIGISSAVIGAVTLLSPLAAHTSVWMFFAARLVIGLAQGSAFPSTTALWGQWAPPTERGRLLSVSHSGSQLGTVMGMSLGGYLAAVYGWESIFYTFGTLCLLWVVPWWFLAYDSPSTHPRISSEEREYIMTAINPGHEQHKLQEKRPIPWRSILTTVPVWALIVVEIGHSWAFYTLLTNLPTYLHNILHFSLKSNGLLSAMPYLVRFVVITCSVFVSDWIRTRNFCSATVLRKAFSISAFVCSGSALVGVALVGCDRTAAVALFTVAVALSGWIFVGHLVNYTEMAPSYNGVLISICNTVGTSTGIIAPYVAGVLTSGENGQSVANWQIVFFIAAGWYGLVSVVYGVFGSSARQKWDSYHQVSKS